MSGARENTLVVDFSVLPVRPDAGKVQTFLENEIKLQYSDVLNIQFHNVRNCVLIEMKDDKVAWRYHKAHNFKHPFVCAKSEFKIPVYVDCEAVTVRVHDLPPKWPHATIMNYMAKYGVVMSIRYERWKHYFPGFLNGVRVLRMKLATAIPSHVTIENEITLVTYANQPKTCRHCGRAAHPKQKCLEVTTSHDNNERSAAAPTATPSTGLFNIADFPAINTGPNQPSTSTQSSPEFTGFPTEDLRPNAIFPFEEHQTMTVENIDDTASSSSCVTTKDLDFIEINNKRRLSKQKENDKKKVCADQCSQNVSQITDHSGAKGLKVFSPKNKSGKEFNFSNKFTQ